MYSYWIIHAPNSSFCLIRIITYLNKSIEVYYPCTFGLLKSSIQWKRTRTPPTKKNFDVFLPTERMQLWNVFYWLKLVWFCFIVKNSFRKRFNLLSKILLFWDILTFWYKMLTFDHLSWIVMGMQRSEFNVFILIHNIFNPFFQFPNQEQNGATTILFIYLRQLTGI